METEVTIVGGEMIGLGLPRGAAGFFNLAGMESRGLTSCCSIGDYVAEMVCDVLR